MIVLCRPCEFVFSIFFQFIVDVIIFCLLRLLPGNLDSGRRIRHSLNFGNFFQWFHTRNRRQCYRWCCRRRCDNCRHCTNFRHNLRSCTFNRGNRFRCPFRFHRSLCKYSARKYCNTHNQGVAAISYRCFFHLDPSFIFPSYTLTNLVYSF